jgi:hypothetical protein
MVQPLLWTGEIKIYYGCDDYCDEREMTINLVFNSGHWNFPRILCRPFSNVHYVDVFQKSRLFNRFCKLLLGFKSVGKVDLEKHDKIAMTNTIVHIHRL